MPRSR